VKRIVCLMIFLLCWTVSVSASSQEKTAGETDLDQAVKVEDFKDVFQTGKFFIAGQPDMKIMQWMKSNGVTLVVNLRTEQENQEIASKGFAEANVIKELGMTYFLLPIGSKESYGPQSVDKLAEALKSADGKVLIHCASAGRATYLWMAYLVRYQGKTINQAADVGRMMKFTLPVEDFLGTKIYLTLEKTR